MARRSRPHPAEIILPPFQAAACPEQIHKRLGLVRGMQRHEAHPLLHALHDLKGQRVRDRILQDMRPPDQHVRVLEQLIREAVFRLKNVRHGDLQLRVLTERPRERPHESLRIDRAHLLHAALHKCLETGVVLVAHLRDKPPLHHAALLCVLIPDRHSDHMCTLRFLTAVLLFDGRQ